METPDHISALRVVGGDLALDFVNTAEGTVDGEIEREHLLGYEDLVFWGCHVGLLSGEDGDRLLRSSSSRTFGRRATDAVTASRSRCLFLTEATSPGPPSS